MLCYLLRVLDLPSLFEDGVRPTVCVSHTLAHALSMCVSQALLALRPMGEWTALNAHCGNLFVSSRSTLQYSEWESPLLGLPCALEQSVEALRSLMEPAAAALCLTLYEMACGYESDSPIPCDFPPHCPRSLVLLLETLCRPVSTPKIPVSLEQIAKMPFFARSASNQSPQIESLPPLDCFSLELMGQYRHAKAARAEDLGLPVSSTLEVLNGKKYPS